MLSTTGQAILQKHLDTMWSHNLNLLKEAHRVSGTIDIEMGLGPPHIIVDDVLLHYCAFEEMERGRAD